MVLRSKRVSWAERLVLVGEKKNTSRILVRKPEGKKPLRLTRKLNYAIKRNIKVLRGNRNTTVMSALMNCQGPQNNGNFLNS
jgi:hypothetical protein